MQQRPPTTRMAMAAAAKTETDAQGIAMLSKCRRLPYLVTSLALNKTPRLQLLRLYNLEEMDKERSDSLWEGALETQPKLEKHKVVPALMPQRHRLEIRFLDNFNNRRLQYNNSKKTVARQYPRCENSKS